MRALSPTGALGATRAAAGEGGFGETVSMLSKTVDDKAKAFQGKVKERQNTKKQMTMGTDDASSPSMTSGDFVRLANQKGKDGNRFASPSHILNPAAERTDQGEEVKKEKVQFEGEMMRKAKENKLKKYYYILEDKELYVYKKKTDKQHKTMVNLVGVFI